MRCPACSSSTAIAVAATLWVGLSFDPADPTEVIGSDPDADFCPDHDRGWDEASPAHCGACGHHGTVAQFRAALAGPTGPTSPASGHYPEPDELISLFGGSRGVHGQHPGYPRTDWQYEANNGDTHLGYWDWVAHQVELALDALYAAGAQPARNHDGALSFFLNNGNQLLLWKVPVELDGEEGPCPFCRDEFPVKAGEQWFLAWTNSPVCPACVAKHNPTVTP